MLSATVSKQVLVAEIASILKKRSKVADMISPLKIGEFCAKTTKKVAEIAEMKRQQTRTPLSAVNHHFTRTVLVACCMYPTKIFDNCPF